MTVQTGKTKRSRSQKGIRSASHGEAQPSAEEGNLEALVAAQPDSARSQKSSAGSHIGRQVAEMEDEEGWHIDQLDLLNVDEHKPAELAPQVSQLEACQLKSEISEQSSSEAALESTGWKGGITNQPMPHEKDCLPPKEDSDIAHEAATSHHGIDSGAEQSGWYSDSLEFAEETDAASQQGESHAIEDAAAQAAGDDKSHSWQQGSPEASSCPAIPQATLHEAKRGADSLAFSNSQIAEQQFECTGRVASSGSSASDDEGGEEVSALHSCWAALLTKQFARDLAGVALRTVDTADGTLVTPGEAENLVNSAKSSGMSARTANSPLLSDFLHPSLS